MPQAGVHQDPRVHQHIPFFPIQIDQAQGHRFAGFGGQGFAELLIVPVRGVLAVERQHPIADFQAGCSGGGVWQGEEDVPPCVKCAE